jgi:hypothetical protein
MVESAELRAVWAAEVARRTRLAVWEHEARQAERAAGAQQEAAWLEAELRLQRDVREAAARVEALSCQASEVCCLVCYLSEN